MLAANRLALETKQPEVLKALESGDASNPQLDFRRMTDRSGRLNFEATVGGRSAAIHSQYDPETEASRLLEVEDPCDTLIILGLGCGYVAREAIRRYPGKNKLIIEPSREVFSEVIETADISDILTSRNVSLLLTNDYARVVNEMIYLFDQAVIYNVQYVQLSGYLRLFKDLWDKIQQEYVRFVSDRVVNLRTINKFNDIWVLNYFRNLRSFEHSSNLNCFHNQFKDMPALLISGGPSLTEALPMLKALQDKAVLAAAGSTITPLLKAGIVPHVMLGIDGGQDMSEVFNQVERDDILFAYVMSLHYDGVERYQGPKVYLRTNVEKNTLFLEKKIKISTPELLAGGSVANVTLDFLMKLGCNPIIMVGQDLAYTNNLTRAEGADGAASIAGHYEEMLKNPEYALEEDRFGNPILTNRVFLSMRRWFELFMSMHGDTTFVNCTTKGLRIANCQEMSLEEAAENWLQMPREGIRDRLHQLHQECIRSNADKLAGVKALKDRLRENCRKTGRQSRMRLEIIEQILKTLQGNDERNRGILIRKLDRLTKEVERSDLFKYFVYPVIRDQLNAFKNTAEAAMQQKRSHLEKLTALYEGLNAQYMEIDRKLRVIQLVLDMEKEHEDGSGNQGAGN